MLLLTLEIKVAKNYTLHLKLIFGLLYLLTVTVTAAVILEAALAVKKQNLLIREK